MANSPGKRLQTDGDRCLLTDATLLKLTIPDAAAYLYRRSNISGWYRYWFCLYGSQLLYFERGQLNRRGLVVGTISLFRHKLTVVNTPKRRYEFEITDLAGKMHVLRTDSDAELHWWVQRLENARNRIPPAHPIGKAEHAVKEQPLNSKLPDTVVETHVRVDHVMCVVHGIGVDEETLASNVRILQENYTEIMAKVYPDLDFGIEFLVIHWRNALTELDVHQKLRAVVPRSPFVEQDEANPLKQLMEHRVVDYVYYTHARYRQHILREVCRQLNEAVRAFRSRRPDYTGGISVMGHSLGAALCYDLLTRRKGDDKTLLMAEHLYLEFDVDNLFCVGSPLGTLLALDNSIGAFCDMSRVPFRLVNIFKYHDPIATRIEPLRDRMWAEVPPVTVPCWMNMGLRESTAEWFGSWWAGQRRYESVTGASIPAATNSGPMETDANGRQSLSRTASLAHAEGANGYEQSQWGDVSRAASLLEDKSVRLDFALQFSSTMEEVSTSWSAIKSHSEYWGNRDAMLLMVTRMIKSSRGLGDGDVGDNSNHNYETTESSTRCIYNDFRDTQLRHNIHSNGEGNNGKFCIKTTRDLENGRHEALTACVAHVVDRIIDEASATHELMRQHPALQVGATAGVDPLRSVKGLDSTMTISELNARITSERSNKANSTDSAQSWTAYLSRGWFGSDTNTKT